MSCTRQFVVAVVAGWFPEFVTIPTALPAAFVGTELSFQALARSFISPTLGAWSEALTVTILP